MSEELFTEYEVPGRGTVLRHEAGHYVVRRPDGAVVGYPAAAGEPSEATAAADIAAALASPPAAPVPAELTRYRFLVALRRELGLNEGAVYALISQLPSGDMQDTARDAFENASTFRRDNALLAAIAAAGSFTVQQIDELFRAGAGYTDLD